MLPGELLRGRVVGPNLLRYRMGFVVLAQVVVLVARLNPIPLVPSKGDDCSRLDVLQHPAKRCLLGGSKEVRHT